MHVLLVSVEMLGWLAAGIQWARLQFECCHVCSFIGSLAGPELIRHLTVALCTDGIICRRQAGASESELVCSYKCVCGAARYCTGDRRTDISRRVPAAAASQADIRRVMCITMILKVRAT